MKETMVDIETLGTEPAGAAVVAVAAAVYELDTGEVLDRGVWFLDPKLTPGRRNLDTVEFWSKQDAAVFSRVMGGTMAPWKFCEAFSEFVALHDAKGHTYWAYPARFDFGHLRELYHSVGHVFPIQYWAERDLTTYRAVARDIAKTQGEEESAALERMIVHVKEANEAAHDPMADVENQVLLKHWLHRYITLGELNP